MLVAWREKAEKGEKADRRAWMEDKVKGGQAEK
jgi:hypothetical protein